MSGILVHEWLARRGGSENVFEVMSRIFPDADRFCLWNDSEGRFEGVNETLLAHTPLRRSRMLAVPFMPFAWRHLPRSDAEWVLCSSHLFAHHARFSGPASEAPKLVYAHTPARYVWVPELDGRGMGLAPRVVSTMLRPLDRLRATEPKAIAANSQFVADRVRDAWQREATVIYPPVDVTHFLADDTDLNPDECTIIERLPAGYLLGFSRFISYKRLELVVEAGIAADAPVVLAGGGPEESRLREYAAARGANVTFVLSPSFPLLRELYRGARALVFAPVEDFGIVPVEAMAMGTPVVANAVGGAAETVIDGRTGALTHSWKGSDLAEAVERASGCSADDCRARALDFDTSVFEHKISAWVQQELGDRPL